MIQAAAVGCARAALVLLAVACLGGAEDDAAALRAFLQAHAGPDAAPAERVVLLGTAHPNVVLLAADAATAHLHARDFDAVLPWRVLDAAALTALASPAIDGADDALVTAWLRLAAAQKPRDRAFADRLDRLRVRAPELAGTVEPAATVASVAPASAGKDAGKSGDKGAEKLAEKSAEKGPEKTDKAGAAPGPVDKPDAASAAPEPLDVAAALADLGGPGEAPAAPTTVAAWDRALFAKDGSIVRGVYVRACASVDTPDIDHRLGPGWDAFHGGAAKPAKKAEDKPDDAKPAGAADAFPQLLLRHPDGEYVWKSKDFKAVDWTGHGGQVLYAPDKASDPGIDRMTFVWSYHENHGPAKFCHVYLLKPCIDPKDGGQWWSNLPDPSITTPAFTAASGKDLVRTATAIGRAEACWANNGVIAFRNGLITYNGSGNSGDPGKPLQLPSGKVPTAVAMTNSAEFALITVWDVNTLKGQVAVIAMKTINWMQPTNGFFSDMKLLGFIDLPKDLRCPSGICAGSDSPFGKEIENADIHDEGKRAKLAEDPNCAATRGFAVVISRAENRACFIDLAPLFQWVRANRLGPAKLFAVTEKPGPDAKEWPFTFAAAPHAKPKVVATIAIEQPTAVMNGYKDGDPGYGSKAVIATMDGKLVLMEVGQLGLASAKPGGIAPVGVLRVGRNPTGFGLGQHNLGPANSFFVTSRGDRSVHWVKVVGNTIVPIKTLRDKRLIDPVAVEPMDARWADVISVADFKGRQVVNYLFRPLTPWYEPLFGGLGEKGDADFECTGTAKLPGCPYAVSGAEVP